MILEIMNKRHLRSEVPILKLGDILTDVNSQNWQVGPLVGTGGNGQVYAANNTNGSKKLKNYKFAIKLESFNNSFITQEINFYQRHAQRSDINEYMRTKNLKNFGLPHYVTYGDHSVNSKTLRFIAMPRFGKEIASFINKEGYGLQEHTVYRLVLRMLDIYEYLHDRGLVHGDLKAENMLLGYGPGGNSKVYLVDFGTVSKVSTSFTPDSKQIFGTNIFNSRDGHSGIPTYRGDLEILGYNMIHWQGVTLPWVAIKQSKSIGRIQGFKEYFMNHIEEDLKTSFGAKVPRPVEEFFRYIALLEIHEKPNLDRCKQIFLRGLEQLKKKDAGKFDLKLKPVTFVKEVVKYVDRKRKFEDQEFGSKKIAKKEKPLEVVEPEFSDASETFELNEDTVRKVFLPLATSSTKRKRPRILNFNESICNKRFKRTDSDKENIPPASQESNKSENMQVERLSEIQCKAVVDVSNCEKNKDMKYVLKPGESILFKNLSNEKNQFETLFLRSNFVRRRSVEY